MFRKMLGGVIGAAIVAGAVVLGVKIAKDIEESTDEDIEYKEKAERYFKEKWKNFREVVDEKNVKIDEIMKKVKEDVVKEVDELKRKEIVQKASEQIAKLKDEIRDIAEERRQDLVKLSEKVKKSGVWKDTKEAVVKTGRSIKRVINSKFNANEVYEVDSVVVEDAAYMD